MKTGGLAHKLTIKLQANVMLTSNIVVSDKLCNGHIRTTPSTITTSFKTR